MGMDVRDQAGIDKLMVTTLDGSKTSGVGLSRSLAPMPPRRVYGSM